MTPTPHPLKSRLRRAGIMQADLAAEAHIAVTHLSAILAGRRSCTARMDVRLQLALGRIVRKRLQELADICAP